MPVLLFVPPSYIHRFVNQSFEASDPSATDSAFWGILAKTGDEVGLVWCLFMVSWGQPACLVGTHVCGFELWTRPTEMDGRLWVCDLRLGCKP